MEGYFIFTIFLLGLSRISNAVTCQQSSVYLSYRLPDNSHRPCLSCVRFTFIRDQVPSCICGLADDIIDSTYFDDVYGSWCRKVLNIRNHYVGSVILETGPNSQWSDLLSFDLSRNNIIDLEPEFFKSLISLRILNLSKNNLKSLKNNILAPLLELQNLDLSQNSITELDEPFKSLIELFEINLSYNEITRISAITFQNQRHLEILLLNNNKIITFEASFPLNPVFIPLQLLDLTWNEIKNITFTGNIQNLNISHNNLTEFSVNLSSSLKFLNLSHNKIVKIGDSAFLKAVNLETIDLSSNYLQSFPTSSFKDQKSLQYIDISNNLFSKNKYGSEDNWASFFLHCNQLRNVSLANNLWECSDLKDILQSLNSHSVNITHGNEHMANNILGIKCIELNNATINSPIDISVISSRITAQVLEEVWAKIENNMNNISSRVSYLENNMVDKLIAKMGNIEKQLSTDHTQKDNIPSYDSNKNTLQAVVLSELSSKIKDLEADRVDKEKLLENDLNTIEQLLRSVNDGANSISGVIIQNLLLLLLLCVLLYFSYVVLKKRGVVARENLNLV